MSGGAGLTTKGLVAGGDSIQYRMRGYDTTLARIVFWTTTQVDALAADYTGPGPVNDIVVEAQLGQLAIVTNRETAVSQMLEVWSQINVAASQTNVPLKAQVSGNFDTVKMLRSGSIIGLSVRLTEAITGGVISVVVTKNGSPVTLQISMASGTGGVMTQVEGIDTYVAGDLIGIQITTTSGFLPNTTDIEATVDVLEIL